MIRVYFSAETQLFLNDVYNELKNPIAYYFLNRGLYSNFSYIDIAKEDRTTITPEVRLIRKLNEYNKDRYYDGKLSTESYINQLNSDKSGYSIFRIEIKIGKLVRKLIEDNKSDWQDFMYNWKSNYNVYKTEDELIEEMVNQYKITTKRIFDKDFHTKFELVNGEDIRKWYYTDRYVKGTGSIHGSCMRHSKCQSFFDIYVQNTEVCSMLIFREETERISIRALVWKLPDGTTYMDRIYSSRNSDTLIFKNYAKERGWTSYDNNNKRPNGVVKIKLKEIRYPAYPYMDSFQYYDRETFTLSNDKFSWTCIKLIDQHGNYVSN